MANQKLIERIGDEETAIELKKRFSTMNKELAELNEEKQRYGSELDELDIITHCKMEKVKEKTGEYNDTMRKCGLDDKKFELSSNFYEMNDCYRKVKEEIILKLKNEIKNGNEKLTQLDLENKQTKHN